MNRTDQLITREISVKPWGPLPLLWVSAGLSWIQNGDSQRFMTEKELSSIRHLVDNQMVYQVSSKFNFFLFNENLLVFRSRF